ncbi:MAG: hypothetical protein ACRDT0_20030 [Pseudonocardiaceae bacterium]
MRAGADRAVRRGELAAAAEELFDALYPEDLAALVARYDSRSMLCDAAVIHADKVADKLAKTADPVRPEEYVRLIAACLTWGKKQSGVAQSTAHAAKKFLRYRRFAQCPFGILVRTDRIVPDDDQVIGLLCRSLRIRAGVTDAGPAREPELILNMVIPAITAALGHRPYQPPDPAADATLVGVALDVLDRAAGLATEYRVARRPVPTVGTDLPVAGNADFLVRIAAYRLAIEERLGRVAVQPLDGLRQAVANLTSVLRKAMTRSARRLGWHGPDEPDVATAFTQYASYLGSAAGDDAVRQAVCRVHSVLSYRLGLDEPPGEIPFEDLGSQLTPSPDGSEQTDRLSDVEHLVGWLVAALFQGACKDARDGLLEWLNGTRLTDQQKCLPLLVRRLRVATRMLDRTPTSPPPRPAGVDPSRLDALSAHLVAAVDPEQIHGCERADARRVTLDALPPLWTRRQPTISLLASHLRAVIEPPRALLVATHGVRAPVQAVQRTASSQPVPCCPDAGSGGRSAASGRPREPVPEQTICPHRPWGEVGWVENYRTLGKAAGCGAEAARKQLERYQGPWPELLWP